MARQLPPTAPVFMPPATARRQVVTMGREAGRLLMDDTAHDAGHGLVHVAPQPEVVRRSASPAR